MTEAKGKPKRRPSAAPVFVASLALFCLLLGLVAYRVGGGSPADAAAAGAPAPKRKLVIRRVVTTVVPSAGAGASAECRRRCTAHRGSGAGGNRPGRTGARHHQLLVMAEHEVSFEAMGSRVRLLIGEPEPGMPSAAVAAAEAQGFVADFEATLSRFDRASELSALNRDRRERVPASPLLRRAVAAGLVAAEQSGGLVDPTLVEEIERAGYVSQPRLDGAGLACRRSGAGDRAPPGRPPSGGSLAGVERRRGGGGDRPPAGAAVRQRRHRQGTGG